MLVRSVLSSPRVFNEGAFYPLLSLQRRLRSIDDLFAASATTENETPALRVRLDVREDETAFYVTADLPGLTDKEVEVTFDEGVLTLRGEKKITRTVENTDKESTGKESTGKKDTWHIAERAHGTFARQLSLGDKVDAAAIAARFDNGVLSVTLPKLPPEKSAARKIEIKGA